MRILCKILGHVWYRQFWRAGDDCKRCGVYRETIDYEYYVLLKEGYVKTTGSAEPISRFAKEPKYP